jgi:transposase-like protein
MPRTRRTFSAEFKAEVVLQLLRGDISQAELCRKHKLTPALLATWKAVVLERMSTLFDAAGNADQDRDQSRIAELERLVGQQAYELAALKKASRLLGGPPTKNGRPS